MWLGAADEATAPVAIKLFHPATPPERIDSEVEALARTSHRHIQRLLDISVDTAGRTSLVLERLHTPLARVVADRPELRLGEAVTMLAPLCEAVTELHRCGIAHGRIDASSVMLDDTGAPVLCRFGAAQLVGDFPAPPSESSLTPADENASEQLLGDRESLASLAETVLTRVHGDRTVLAWLTQQRFTPRGFAHELAERLYAAAPGEPITVPHTRASRGAPAHDIRAQFQPSGAPHSIESTGADAPREPAARSWWSDSVAAGLMPEWLEQWLDRMRADWLPTSSDSDAPGTIRHIIECTRQALTAVRHRVWLLAAAGCAAVVTAALLIALDGTHTADAANDQHTPAVSTPPQGTADTPEAHTTDALPESPLDAAHELLTRRQECLRSLSVLCLDTVHQPGSAAMEADRHRIRQQQQGHHSPTRTDWSLAELTLYDELGDGALIDATLNSATATLLLVRTDDGWRIRDLIE